MFDPTAIKISDLHQEALPRSVCAQQLPCQVRLAEFPLGWRVRLVLGRLLVRAGQKLQHCPLPQPDPSPVLFITL